MCGMICCFTKLCLSKVKLDNQMALHTLYVLQTPIFCKLLHPDYHPKMNRPSTFSTFYKRLSSGLSSKSLKCAAQQRVWTTAMVCVPFPWRPGLTWARSVRWDAASKILEKNIHFVMGAWSQLSSYLVVRERFLRSELGVWREIPEMGSDKRSYHLVI